MITPNCRPLLIGSLPITNHQQAADIILRYTPEIPLWPQLPKNPREGMVRQFLTGFPGLIDSNKGFWIDTEAEDFAVSMTAFYEEYMAVEANHDLLKDSRFRLAADSASGFSVLLDTLHLRKHDSYTVKGQVTGPITTGIGAKTGQGESIFYDDNLRDMLVKHLTMKGCWQARQIQQRAKIKTPIIFIDEPAMVSFGSSAFVGITRELVTESMSEIISGIRATGALVGVHICANGDWAPVLQSKADIISFDAYSYFENLLLFKEELTSFLQRGGILAWGIVPTGDPEIISKETVTSLLDKFKTQLNQLTALGFVKESLLQRVFITPSCGTGSLPLNTALDVLEMNSTLSYEIQKKFMTP
ncbi:hypothetical protein [Desulfosediminicola ganghwensis]|uniref:hypothetical protein n=1 Tax=Desulfosediminicola ganghwensis TaxID=2569540 RepID=UPI0010ACD01D|nr:hypothetical protein [Desulfosediminicola ganghwensis]